MSENELMQSGKSPCKPELVIVVGASAGGLQEIKVLVERLPQWFRGTMIIAMHRSPGSGNILAKILEHRARVEVHSPADEQEIECTTVYVGDADEKVEVDTDQFDISIDSSTYARMHRIDDLFQSVADTVGKNAVGVILSGMLSDGVDGLEAIQRAGGYCIVQTPSDALFKSMPNNAIERIRPDMIGTTEEIASAIMELAIVRSSQRE